MVAGLIEPVPEGKPTFANAQRVNDLAELAADIAVIGVPYGVPYSMAGATFPASTAPAAIRAASLRWASYLTHYDYDFGGDVFHGRDVTIADCGTVTMATGQWNENSQATTAVIAAILDRGAVPIVLGGDHSIPIPVMRAYAERESMCVVQVDAHLDWREEINGVHEGLSSPMRRASELACVAGMAQIGLRGVGSARADEYAAARAYGSVLIGASEVHRDGTDAILARIPAADRYYVTFDVDGLDPSVAPGVGYPAFGGLTYDQASALLRGLASKGRIVGCDVVEMVPDHDVRNLTALMVARLMLNLIGSMAWSGQVGRSDVGQAP